MSSNRKPVAVVIGATSKWQSDGRNTRLIHGGEIDDSDLPIGVRWGVGGAISQKFASEGFLVSADHPHCVQCCISASCYRRAGWGEHHRRARPVVAGVRFQMRLPRFARRPATRTFLFTTRATWKGATSRPKKSCSNTSPIEILRDGAAHLQQRAIPSCQGSPAHHAGARRRLDPILQQLVLAAADRKRYTGQSLYYPRVLMRTLAQALTEEYSEYGVHVANVVIDGTIDSPGTRAMPRSQAAP